MKVMDAGGTTYLSFLYEGTQCSGHFQPATRTATLYFYLLRPRARSCTGWSIRTRRR